MTPPAQAASALGAGLGLAAALVLALTAWARCSELGPVVRVHPAIRALDAGRER